MSAIKFLLPRVSSYIRLNTFTRCFTSTSPIRSNKVKFTFVEPDGEEVVVEADVGDTLLDIAHDNEIEIEGACGGECACSTCHVILESELYDSLEEPEEEEEDMLDLALNLTDTSRLGCQIEVTEAMNGVKIYLPEETDNALS
eukprot:g5884.t1